MEKRAPCNFVPLHVVIQTAPWPAGCGHSKGGEFAVKLERLAGVAQSVEQLIRNEKVGCSIHLSGTNKIKESPLSKP